MALRREHRPRAFPCGAGRPRDRPRILGFPTIASSRISLALDLAKHVVTAVTAVAALLRPTRGAVIEFATLAVSLASVAETAYRRFGLLRRRDDDDVSPRAEGSSSSAIEFTANPFSKIAPKREAELS